MDLRLLEMFLRVAELGSINKAAANLQMPQPTLSRHIATLEHEMRSPLFMRTQGGVHLTDSGRLLADRVRPLLRQFSILKEQVGEKAAGQLAIGTPPAWKHLFTSPFVEKLTSEQPGIALRVYEGLSNVLRESMFSGLLDIAVVPFDTLPPTGYSQTALVREPIVVVGPRNEGLSPGTPVGIHWLDGRKMVLAARPNALRVQVERALERKGLTLRLAVETDTQSLCLEFARRGVGLAAVPASSLYGPDNDEGLCWAPIRGQFVTWALCENMARSHSQSVREGRRLAIDTVANALAMNRWFGAESALRSG